MDFENYRITIRRAAEAAHIYDPKTTILKAYRVLFKQWSLAFEISAANRRRGARPLTFRKLRSLLQRARA